MATTSEPTTTNEADSVQVRQLAACEAALTRYPKQSADSLRALVLLARDSDHVVRVRAAECLMEIGTERAIIGLIDLLHDPHPQVRTTAIRALGALRARVAVRPLRRVLADEADPAIKIAAARALGRMGDRGGLATVIKFLYGGNETYPRMAALALRDIIGQTFSPTLEGIREAKRYLEVHESKHFIGDVS